MKYIVVGCGITGGSIARVLAEAGHTVEIWDRRSHIAGNMYDYVDDYGVRVQKYGPHIFHTSNKIVWDFVNRFEEWKPFKLVCGASWGGKFTPTAFNFRTIDVFYSEEQAERLKQKLLRAYPGQSSANIYELLNNNDPDIKGYAQFLFENDYAPYTAKQWGVKVSEIDPSVLKRVPIRFSYDESYFTDSYEALPVHSYTKMFENMLDHKNIELVLGIEALTRITIKNKRVLVDNDPSFTVIFTGNVDELFDFQFGKLPYRSLRFEWKHSDSDSYQDAPVVAYPQAPLYTRITEYKKLPVQHVYGTSYAVEYPIPYDRGVDNEPYYPVLTEKSQEQYKKYKALSDTITNLICCGRLASFKYYNMDQALEVALNVAERIISECPNRLET